MAAAARAYGSAVLRSRGRQGDRADVTLGRDLVQHLCAGKPAIPQAVRELIANPDSKRARDALEEYLDDALHEDSGSEAALAEELAAYYLREFEVGNTQAMVDLGFLLRQRDDPQAARAAFQQAIDVGDTHAQIDLASLLRGDLNDLAGARAALQQAISSADPDVAAEAMVELGYLLMLSQGDTAEAQAAFQQAIRTAHSEWAPAAWVGLGQLMHRQGDAIGAQDAYQRAINADNVESSSSASVRLADLLRSHGDTARARDANQKVLYRPHPDRASAAYISQRNLLRDYGCIDTSTLPYRTGLETGNPEAPYALPQRTRSRVQTPPR